MKKILAIALGLVLSGASVAQVGAPEAKTSDKSAKVKQEEVKEPAKAGVLANAEVRKLVPPFFFFHGQSAPTQLRNSAAVRLKSDGRVLLAGLVDTSGYSADVAERFQGFLITEARIVVAGQALQPGAYGIGTTEKGEFVLQDLGWNDLIISTATVDEEMKRPRPLQITGDNGVYRLYMGKKWVEIRE